MNELNLKSKIFAVDDDPTILRQISLILGQKYEIKLFKSGTLLLQYLMENRDEIPDLILLDVSMPDLSGYEVITKLKRDSLLGDIPVIFLTASSDGESEAKGLELGAVDYITKPFHPKVLLSRIRTHLLNKEAQELTVSYASFLESEVERRTREIKKTQELIIYISTFLAESRDNDTGNHIIRTREYVKILTNHLKNYPRFRDYLTEKRIEMIYTAAPLHDIGKIGIPDSILLKPGKLTAEEFDIMKRHTTIGKEVIERAEKIVGIKLELLDIIKQIFYYHHEKWNGRGYPEGLKGEEIPIPARLMALANVFDALASKRCYRDSFPIEQVIEEIKRGRGEHFDPDVVDAFFANIESFISIQKKFCDS